MGVKNAPNAQKVNDKLKLGSFEKRRGVRQLIVFQGGTADSSKNKKGGKNGENNVLS